MQYWDERERLLGVARQMNLCRINESTSGNLSMRIGDGFLITPSAVPYDQCTSRDLILMDSDGRQLEPGRASSEWRLHRDILASRPEVGAVLHAHAPWCTTLACLHREIPAFHYLVAIAGGNTIRCAPYALFGTQALSDAVMVALEDRTACLLANHGLVTLGEDPESAFRLAIEVENLAKIYARALHIGEPVILDEDQMSEVRARIEEYRRPPENG